MLLYKSKLTASNNGGGFLLSTPISITNPGSFLNAVANLARLCPNFKAAFFGSTFKPRS